MSSILRKTASAMLILSILATHVSVFEAIKCVKCNSARDDWCDDADEIAKVVAGEAHQDGIQDCAKEEVPKDITPIVSHCRKIEQIIETVSDDSRIIRECAFTGEVADGMKRTGNKGIRIFYYQCDEDLCNPAPTVRPIGLLTSLVTIVGVYLAL